jgi:hypothetical protein
MKAITAAALALACALSHASTTATYTGKCRMYVEHRFKFEGLCRITYGLDGAAGTSMVYRLTPPPEGGHEIEVRHFPKRTGTIDGTPAKEIAVTPGWLHFEASNGVDLRFTAPPKDV